MNAKKFMLPFFAMLTLIMVGFLGARFGVGVGVKLSICLKFRIMLET